MAAKKDFVYWPFRRVPVSLAECCLFLVDRILVDVQSQILRGASSRFWCSGLGSLVWG